MQIPLCVLLRQLGLSRHQNYYMELKGIGTCTCLTSNADNFTHCSLGTAYGTALKSVYGLYSCLFLVSASTLLLVVTAILGNGNTGTWLFTTTAARLNFTAQPFHGITPLSGIEWGIRHWQSISFYFILFKYPYHCATKSWLCNTAH